MFNTTEKLRNEPFYNKQMFLNLLLISIFVKEIAAASQCCEQLNQLACIKCPENMHLYRNNCIYNIPNCLQYLNGFDCVQCEVNYQLINSECRHVRLLIDPQRISNYTPYLQSAIKPNLLFNQALEILTNNIEVWSDWLKEVRQSPNESSSGARDDSKEAAILQKRIMKSKKSLLHYIYTAQYHLNGSILNIFRLSYEIGSPSGFADILLAIQQNQGKVQYLQIVQVRINELSQGWQQLSNNYQLQVQKQLSDLFPTINNYLLMKGWWIKTKKGYNFTLYELDDVLGVISYSYQIRSEDIISMGLNLTVSSIQSIHNSSQLVQAESNITKLQDKTKKTNQPTNQTKTQPIDNSLKNVTDKSKQTNHSTDIHIPTQVKNSTGLSQKQLILDPATIQINDNIVTGYAVAIKFQYVSRSALIEGASVFPYNATYCLYLAENSTYYQLMFQINTIMSMLQVISFRSSKTSLLTVSNSTNASSQVLNSTYNYSTSSQNGNITINANMTNINSTSNQTKKPQTFNTTNGSSITKANATAMPELKPLILTNLTNQNSTECLQTSSTPIDITSQINEDVFMPKINLLLTTMYADTLQDSRIGEASYSWSVDMTTKISSLTYDIIYLTSLNEYYQFQVQIVNNQIKFTKIPANIKESGTTPVAAKNKTNVAIFSNTPTKLNQIQNSSANTSTAAAGAATTANKVISNTNSFLQNNLLNQSQAQSNTSTSNSSYQNNLSTESNKANLNPGQIKKADNLTIATSQVVSNVSQIKRSVVSPTDFSENPKYKPIVDIVCMIKHVPMNATFIQMEEWTVQNQSHYSILMSMNYTIPLNNGSTQKLFYFQVKVNANSYVTIVIYNVSFCCIQNNSNTTATTNPGPLSLIKPDLLKSIGGIIQLSPYSNILISKIRDTSVGLSKTTVQMLSFAQTEHYSDFGNCFSQKLRFKDSNKVLCFQFDYCVPDTSDSTLTNSVYVRNYRVMNCSESKEENFLYSLINAQFVETQSQNLELNSILAKLYSKGELIFEHYQNYLDFYFVVFYEPPYGNLSFLYDSKNKIILSFNQNPTIQTSSEKSFNQSFNQAIQVEIQKTLHLSNNTFQIILVEKNQLSDKIALLNIYFVQKIEFYGAQFKKLYFLEAEYDQILATISLLTYNQVANGLPPTIQINSDIIPKMYQVSLKRIVQNNKFIDIMSQINLKYQSFMQASQLQAVLMPSQAEMEDFLANNLTADITIKIILMKKYTDNNYSSYTITALYNPSTNNTEFKGIELVSSEVLLVVNCGKSSQQLGLPICTACNQGYKLIQGICVTEITGCSQYYQSFCISCSSGHVSSLLSSCQPSDFDESPIKIVNTYLIELSQNL